MLTRGADNERKHETRLERKVLEKQPATLQERHESDEDRVSEAQREEMALQRNLTPILTSLKLEV